MPDFIHTLLCAIAGRLVINSEENSLRPAINLDVTKSGLETRSYYPSSVCTAGRQCVPMSDCSALYYEAAKSCFAGDRSMYCGGTQYEPYICCPKSPLEQSQVCGKSLVSGQSYKGLGAFPFLARIGFKSKYFLLSV